MIDSSSIYNLICDIQRDLRGYNKNTKIANTDEYNEQYELLNSIISIEESKTYFRKKNFRRYFFANINAVKLIQDLNSSDRELLEKIHDNFWQRVHELFSIERKKLYITNSGLIDYDIDIDDYIDKSSFDPLMVKWFLFTNLDGIFRYFQKDCALVSEFVLDGRYHSIDYFVTYEGVRYTSTRDAILNQLKAADFTKVLSSGFFDYDAFMQPKPFELNMVVNKLDLSIWKRQLTKIKVKRSNYDKVQDTFSSDPDLALEQMKLLMPMIGGFKWFDNDYYYGRHFNLYKDAKNALKKSTTLE